MVKKKVVISWRVLHEKGQETALLGWWICLYLDLASGLCVCAHVKSQETRMFVCFTVYML